MSRLRRSVCTTARPLVYSAAPAASVAALVAVVVMVAAVVVVVVVMAVVAVVSVAVAVASAVAVTSVLTSVAEAVNPGDDRTRRTASWSSRSPGFDRVVPASGRLPPDAWRVRADEAGLQVSEGEQLCLLRSAADSRRLGPLGASCRGATRQGRRGRPTPSRPSRQPAVSVLR